MLEDKKGYNRENSEHSSPTGNTIAACYKYVIGFKFIFFFFCVITGQLMKHVTVIMESTIKHTQHSHRFDRDEYCTKYHSCILVVFKVLQMRSTLL